MTKCQITCKSLQKSSKCQNFLRVWHLVIFRADQLKKPPCMYLHIYTLKDFLPLRDTRDIGLSWLFCQFWVKDDCSSHKLCYLASSFTAQHRSKTDRNKQFCRHLIVWRGTVKGKKELYRYPSTSVLIIIIPTRYFSDYKYA